MDFQLCWLLRVYVGGLVYLGLFFGRGFCSGFSDFESVVEFGFDASV